MYNPDCSILARCTATSSSKPLVVSVFVSEFVCVFFVPIPATPQHVILFKHVVTEINYIHPPHPYDRWVHVRHVPMTIFVGACNKRGVPRLGRGLKRSDQQPVTLLLLMYCCAAVYSVSYIWEVAVGASKRSTCSTRVYLSFQSAREISKHRQVDFLQRYEINVEQLVNRVRLSLGIFLSTNGRRGNRAPPKRGAIKKKVLKASHKRVAAAGSFFSRDTENVWLPFFVVVGRK